MDLFNKAKRVSKPEQASYSAKDIEVLEGLEPVRLRPGMYIGGTDLNALHHMFTEVIDNSMDEAVAGHAKQIKVYLNADNTICIADDGRGIPVDPHPKYPDKSALEVILTMLHSGGKFSNKVYATSGGLHGVGISVVNALSEKFDVVVYRNGQKYSQSYSRGIPINTLTSEPCKQSLHGTEITFAPDPQIFGSIKFEPATLYRLSCSRGYLYRGVEILWSCDEAICGDSVPSKQTIHYPNGLSDYIVDYTKSLEPVVPEIFAGSAEFPDSIGKLEWAINWLSYGDGFAKYYCNTVYTPYGGTHEQGFKNGLLKAIKNYGELTGNNKLGAISADDIFASAVCIASIFIKNPIFQGQTKDKLLSAEATKLVENAVRPQFENWLITSPKVAGILIEKILQDCEERLNRKKSKEVARKSPIKSMRLPGKLTDCASDAKSGSEIFLVEGESAGGSAKQARNRENQAILPLKGKILNVASSSSDKIKANTEIRDLLTALGCGSGKHYREEDLRYEKVVIMTDADVDGAHITSLLLTFFYKQMPQLIENGHLYIAQPPLYKINYQNKPIYAASDVELEKILGKIGKSRSKVEIGRFKGLGEMTAPQLKETTMDPKKRTLLKVEIAAGEELSKTVDELMGKDPEPRFRFIKERSQENTSDLEGIIDV
ncbi:MAG: DNA topoisomerase IV subunit B [Candidatus Jidaibacter sp.]|nr:DNA topoisomerase IV subunit B [Candidatus Jidaibacter sp.]